VTITADNCIGLSQITNEFGFHDLSAQLSRFRDSASFQDQTRVHIFALEELLRSRDRRIAALECELSRQSRTHESAVAMLVGRVARLEADRADDQAAAERLSTEIAEVRYELCHTKNKLKRLDQLRSDVERLRGMMSDVNELAETANAIAAASQSASEETLKKVDTLKPRIPYVPVAYDSPSRRAREQAFGTFRSRSETGLPMQRYKYAEWPPISTRWRPEGK
jgi:uncharacterized coiled-coil protein SlyX